MVLARNIIRIRAEDSPNVAQYLWELERGQTPTFKTVLPGVLSAREYVHRRATWDKSRQVVGLDGEFDESGTNLLFPEAWLSRASEVARNSLGRGKRTARAVGIDPAEGGDKTALAAVDERGLIELLSLPTPDTAIIADLTVEFGKRWNCEPINWVFDAGGGGKQHADRLRAGYKGTRYPVRTVRFGEAISLDPRRGLNNIDTRMDTKEDRYTYLNRRVEMYHELSLLCDPALNPQGFGIPFYLGGAYDELRKELMVFPKQTNEDGRYVLPPKSKRDSKDTRQTLTEMIGHSPDEADALVLAVHGMLHKPKRSEAGPV